jgi:hypothetical protein
MLAALGISALVATALPMESVAQTTNKQTNNKQTVTKKASSKVIKITNDSSLPKISMDVRNAPLRRALTKLFYSSGVDFVLEGNIPTGVVTAKIKNQPFETALRLVLDASDTPLTYQRTGKVFLISAAPTRNINRNVTVADNTVPTTNIPAEMSNGTAWENEATVATGYSFGPAPTGGFQASPSANGLILNPSGAPTGRTFGPLFGQPFGFPPVIYANPGFGYPGVFNNPGGFYGWSTGPVNPGFGGSGFYFVTP